VSRLIHRTDKLVHLQIEQRENEGIIILDLRGRLVLGQEDLALRQRLQALREAGSKNVALNLKDVSELDSTALGTLVFCATKFREAGGQLVLFNLSPAHSRLSDVVKLNTAFEIYPDQVAAVNSFFPDRAVQHYDILEFVEELEQKRHGSNIEAGSKNE
jgi:anti-sigma B factor antagonist